MAAPQGQYPPQGYPPQDGYAQSPPPDGNYASQPADSSGAPPSAQATGPGGRKKRAYAGQAYEFGAGANAGLGGQTQNAGGFGGGFDQRTHSAGQPPAAFADAQTAPGVGYGQPDAAGVGGYQPPTPSYPGQPNMAGVTQQFQQMGMGDKQPQQSQPQMQRGHQLNMLYPTDLLNQPFNVAELDYPPPPIVLPPNVSKFCLTRPSIELTCE